MIFLADEVIKSKSEVRHSSEYIVDDEAEGAIPGVDDLLAGEEVFRNSRCDCHCIFSIFELDIFIFVFLLFLYFCVTGILGFVKW